MDLLNLFFEIITSFPAPRKAKKSWKSEFIANLLAILFLSALAFCIVLFRKLTNW